MTKKKIDSAGPIDNPAEARAIPPATGRVQPARGPPAPLTIVAIGTSAGGLEAASALLAALPAMTGMAYVLVQHLDPNHPSLLVELLSEHTPMTVAEAVDGALLGPDQVCVIPPGQYLSVRAGAVHLSPPPARRGARLPFDYLLTSLAAQCGPRTIAVVLSGSGADGSTAIPALKAAGGHIIVQDPAEAGYDGMPTSAIATGAVDQTLTVAAMPKALIDLARRTMPIAPAPAVAMRPAGLDAIIALLKERTPHDFREYKPGTLERRIERRIALLGLERGNLSAYCERLEHDAAEREGLARDILINVTGFFRDIAVFDKLAATIIPDLVRALPEGAALRVWIAACSSGEEAYSIAMVCHEAIAASGRAVKLQVFASDVDPDAIATAREGLYAAEVASRIGADRLARYFVREEPGYRVAATLRGDVVFTVQDVLRDPPFSRIDLVSCRNLLIYLNPEAQAKVIALFHFALRPGGVLLLGSSETVGAAGDQFEVLAKSERFYRQIARSRIGNLGFAQSQDAALQPPETIAQAALAARQPTLADLCSRAIMASHAPAAILIDSRRQCRYVVGPVDRYLRLAPGYATLDVLALATPALRTKLRLAIDQVGKSGQRVAVSRTRITHDRASIWFSCDVQALPAEPEDLVLVCFLEEPEPGPVSAAGGGDGEGSRVAELETELAATQAELQTAILNQEIASQDQKAINEEAVSVNEEFQSTNEELLTSKEELQSLNEELNVLNSQLQETLERQRLTSDDLQNVLYSTNIGTLFLDLDLKIRFYTPAIKTVFSLIAGDVGRPLADLKPIVADPDLLADAGNVVADGITVEREIAGPGDAWFLRRIFPYRAHDNRIEGVVITFADITERSLIAKALEASKLEAERANLAKSRFLAAASHDLRQPMQSLTLLHELLTQTSDEDKRRKLLGRVDSTLGAMSGMLNALLDINQIESGVITAQVATFPLAEVFDRLRDEFTYMAQTRSLKLRIMPTRALVESDPRLLEQMIRNLLGNAIKYTRKGKILLGCRRRGGALRVEVWDTGIGIAESERHAIFDEFHQIGNDARERTRGLGLGLSIVQRLGLLLGHGIDVRSILGTGSVFTIAIGAGPPAPSVVRSPADRPVAEPVGRRHCKIVIVDDDPDVLELLEELVRRDGHIVRVAADAEAALNLVAGGAIRPEILLTDYNLPGAMNGLDLLQALRANRPDGLAGILLTGDISGETLKRIAGQDCVLLNKPVKSSELAAAIERLCPLAGAEPLPAAGHGQGHDAGGKLEDTTPIAFVVDDDPEIRVTIREVLEGDGRTVRDFASAEAFLAEYRAVGDGCLLLDAHLPGMSGVALIETLRSRGDRLPTILITGQSDIGLAVQAMRSGACDFIEKPFGRKELLASIARAIADSHEIRLSDASQLAAIDLIAGLTPRQREIMDMVLAGHPSKNIAADLGISQRTVENHRAAVMRRMGTRSLPELARKVQAAASRP